MDFAALPPEVNSALMYAGPGSGPMLAAAAAWEGLAAELQSVASSYLAVVNGLTDGPWHGPSAAAMAAAALPQISWLNVAAGQASEVAAQAIAASSAYEAAFLATVPPPEIEANRALLATLLATNFLGQNTAAIAATEAQYLEMWAQDAAAMYSYSAATAAATQLPQLTPQSTGISMAGLGSQVNAQVSALNAAAAAQGMGDIPTTLSQMAGLTNLPPWLADPAAALGLTGHTWTADGAGIVLNGMLGDVVEGITGSATVDGSTIFDAYIRLASPARLSTTMMRDLDGLAHSFIPNLGKAAEGAAAAAQGAAAAAAPALGNLGNVLGTGLGGITGTASKVGALSVPASWANALPGAATPVNVALNGLTSGAAAESAVGGFGGVPLMPGAGTGRSVANFAAPRYGFKPNVVAQPFAGG
ncbi:PPE family protein [Mycobacterium intermedium]|uniref:PPE family protein n=1 Tax=Mycobacterium intermedium TaxID=28445 RepID=A0A1E3SEM4_MYCIE|nr:PPE family protein [Mycobacterium intermedium]MCV6965535.1 PPE family protein [Mycobacterium intermedium]ODR00545.1 hypothetical protein BHQ20_12310 [Mycobacterium intermedium]OPE48943.1 PPE family protein [Mycobacterium intermedium]ORA98979.1 PPE family protein [Mycobacterium intermedium]